MIEPLDYDDDDFYVRRERDSFWPRVAAVAGALVVVVALWVM